MSLESVLAGDRRLVILRVLSEVAGFAQNEGVLRLALREIGHQEASHELVRADLEFLLRHNLIRVDKLHMPSGELWVVHLEDAGLDVANGTPHEGVARRTPGS